MGQLIYLDHAAATPLDSRVFKVMQPYFSQSFFNPSATYTEAKKVKAHLEDARSSIALTLGAKSPEIIFTAGGTEANNLAVKGVMDNYKDANMIISSVEHESVIEPSKEYKYQTVPVAKDGIVDIGKVISLVNDKTVLVSIMYANNEVGTIQPIKRISQALADIKRVRVKNGNTYPLYFHTDAAQAANYLDLHVHSLGVDMMSLNGGKIYGPKQSGVLYISSEVKLRPQILGGGQELGLRNGTENVANDIGLATALHIAFEMRRAETERLSDLRDYFIKCLNQKFKDLIINGSLKYRLPNNIHVTFPGIDNERLLIELEGEGILAAAGSACSASSDEPSHVLSAMDLSDDLAQSSIRFTLGRSTTKAEIDTVISVLKNFVS